MLEKNLQKLEELITKHQRLNPEQRKELQALVKTLRQELESLEKTESSHAATIAKFAHQVAHHSNQAADMKTQHEAGNQLKRSIRQFEVSHPNLTRVIQQICLAFGV